MTTERTSGRETSGTTARSLVPRPPTMGKNPIASRLTLSLLGFVFLLGCVPSAQASLAFGPPTPIGTDAATDQADDTLPSIATDGRSWVVVWEARDRFGSDTDVVFARSVDGGRTWTQPAVIDPSESTDGRNDRDESPSVVASRNGTFLAIWISSDPTGPDRPTGCLVARSVDGGASWGAPVAAVGASCTAATIATDGAGVWVIAAFAGLHEVTTVRSVDDGLSWGGPIMHGSPTAGFTPQVASDGHNWLVTFSSFKPLEDSVTQAGDDDIYAIRSTDGGLTWSPSFALDPGNAGDSRPDGGEVRVAASPAGT